MARDYVLQSVRPAVDLRIDYAAELNPAQLAAVTAPPGPALVIAGAGSGKTRTLTYRVAYLLEQGVAADRILLLTFTNKAAGEMMRRVAELLGHDTGALWGGTFHSIGCRTLRQHASVLGLPSGFTIQDRDDAKELIKACVADAGVDTKAGKFPKPEVLGEIFSLAANKCVPVREVIDTQYPWLLELADTVAAIQERYTARKRTNGMTDFDDLLVLWLRLLREQEDVCELYQRRFQFVLVDEYQDTNPLQAQIIDLLGARHRNVMGVGDDSQSIYSWRGADFRNILDFGRRYPGAQIYKVETNYRSTPEILALANAAIAANTQQLPKALIPARGSGDKPVLVTCAAADEQSAFVAQRALELREEGVPLREMAVLYRSHFHALELQLELTRRNIPFSITSGIRFFEQAHVKDVTAYLRWVGNPRDELAFKRLALMLPGIGPKGAHALWGAMVSSAVAGQSLEAALMRCARIPKRAQAAWAQLAATISQLEAEPVRHDAGQMIQIIIEAGYEEYVAANYDRPQMRLDDLEQLAVFARKYDSLELFLAELALLTNIETEEARPANDEDDRLRLSTIHQAKGLEFKVVFVIMLCDGLFPSSRSLNSVEGEEEERRLFYVAVTRAKDWLHLSYPLMRTVAAASAGDAMQTPSRFLRELPEELLDQWALRSSLPYG